MASELDAKVAECLGKKPRISYISITYDGFNGEILAGGMQDDQDVKLSEAIDTARRLELEGQTGITHRTVYEFRPSTDPAACEDVKAEIRRRGWDYTVTTDKYLPEHRSFNCEVSTYVTNTSMKVFQGATEYEAVCKAFVAACGR